MGLDLLVKWKAVVYVKEATHCLGSETIALHTAGRIATYLTATPEELTNKQRAHHDTTFKSSWILHTHPLSPTSAAPSTTENLVYQLSRMLVIPDTHHFRPYLWPWFRLCRPCIPRLPPQRTWGATGPVAKDTLGLQLADLPLGSTTFVPAGRVFPSGG